MEIYWRELQRNAARTRERIVFDKIITALDFWLSFNEKELICCKGK
jgi:hypothetical protein